MVLLFVTLWKYEMASKHASMQLRALRRRLLGDEEEEAVAARRSAAPQHA
jgi:heme exporter protein C